MIVPVERPVLAVSLWLGICLAIFIPLEVATGHSVHDGLVAGIATFLMSIAVGAAALLLYRLSRTGVPDTSADAAGASAPLSLRDAAKLLGIIAIPCGVGIIIGAAVGVISGSRSGAAVGFGAGIAGTATVGIYRARARGVHIDPFGLMAFLVLITAATIGLAGGPAAVHWPLFGLGLVLLLVSWRRREESD